MSEQQMFAVKPGNNRSKINNANFRKNQIKIHQKNRDTVNYIDPQHEFKSKQNKNQQHSTNQYLCKFGKRGNYAAVSGFNFKKCNATKFIYGTGMYKYTYSRDYDQQLINERNVQKKCRQKLRNQLCLKWQ